MSILPATTNFTFSASQSVHLFTETASQDYIDFDLLAASTAEPFINCVATILQSLLSLSSAIIHRFGFTTSLYVFTLMQIQMLVIRSAHFVFICLQWMRFSVREGLST